MRKANVIGVGIGKKNADGELSIVVTVKEKVPLKDLKRRDRVPKKVSGVRTDVVVKPQFRFLGRTDRVRPAVPGVSIAHKDVTAGTFGCLVEDVDGKRLILSNNHVLANSNKGVPGDLILQPGPYDGGVEPPIATLLPYIPIGTGGSNPGGDLPSECAIIGALVDLINGMTKFVGSKQYLVALEEGEDTNLFDAALAEPIDPGDVRPEIMEIGMPTGATTAEIGETIKKSGRATGLTTGTVEQIHATVQVDMGSGQIVTFEDQVISDLHCEGGDSGSAVLNENNEVVGLLFAGGEGTMVHCEILNILPAYNVKIVTTI
jgi:hypothetical protein